MLMIFDSFTRCEQVMGALHAQQCEDFPLPVEDAQGAVVGHVLPYSYREQLIDTCLVMAKQSAGLQGWRTKLNAMIAAHPDVSAILVFHNDLPPNTREPPVTHLNPGVDTIMLALGGPPLNDRDRAALGRAIQLRRQPVLARSRTARDAQMRRVFAGGLQATTPLSAVQTQTLQQLMQQHQQQQTQDDDDDLDAVPLMQVVVDEEEEEEDLQRALRDSLAEAQPARPKRPLERTWQEVLREDGEVAATGQPVCIACHHNRASILFLPCSHQPMCDKCARAWMEATPRCPVCRADCINLVRPFLPGGAGGE